MADRKPLKTGVAGDPAEFAPGDTINASFISGLPQPIISGLTSGEAYSEGDALYIDSTDGKLYKADASDTSKMPARGVAGEDSAGADEAGKTLQTRASKDGYTGLTPGKSQFVSATTAGALTETKPADGNTIQKMGFAINATTVNVEVTRTIKTEA